MDEFEYLEKSKNEIITIDNLNKKNDCFIRYLFSDEGNENIVLDFINGVMIDLNFQTFNMINVELKKRDYDIAKNLKQMNIDNASISKATGLSIEEIKKL